MAIPKKVAERIQAGLKHYVPILNGLRDRDVAEADTVTVVKDILSDVLGFDKYTEVTGELAIRGTYCDLAIKIDGKIQTLIEVKAVGIELQERQIKQCIDYAANQGVDWAVLTNGAEWILYHVLFKKPIDKEEVIRIDLRQVNAKSQADLEKVFLLSRDAIVRNARTEYRDRKDATSHYMMAAIVLGSEAIHNLVRREIKQISGILVDRGFIEKVLREQVIKREAIEGDHADNARKRLMRKNSKAKRLAEAGAPSDRTESISNSNGDIAPPQQSELP